MRSHVLAPLAAGGLLVLLAGRAGSDGPIDDGVPSGTVAFFAQGATCPEGWVRAADANGRLIVAVTDGVGVGRQVGTALSDQEDRAHRHGYAPSLALPPKDIAAANGPNIEGAKAQTYAWKETSAPAPTGLAFAQLLVCEKP